MVEENCQAGLSPYLAETVLVYGCAFDPDRFLPYVRKAYEMGYMDAEILSSEEDFIRDLDTKEDLYLGFHYKTSQQSLETWLRRIINGELALD